MMMEPKLIMVEKRTRAIGRIIDIKKRSVIRNSRGLKGW
jgi:hypothetical protein